MKRFVFDTLTKRIQRLRSLLVGVARRLRRSFGQPEAVVGPLDTLVHSQKIIEMASAQAKIGVWQCDLVTGALAWTDGVYALFELPPGSRVTRSQSLALYASESREQMEILRARAIREGTGFTLDARIKTAMGNERWMRLTATVECENGVAVRLFGMKQDITQERVLLERLRSLAETDPLTGLSNRSRMHARLEASATDGGVGALLLIDLDGFKRVNDTLGHAAGDECLRQTAKRLREACTQKNLIARFGGDEFAIVTERGTTQAEMEALADILLAALRRPIDWNGRRFQISASIGIALSPSSRAQDASLLLSDADVALYAAKAAGRNKARIFGPDLLAQSEGRLLSQGELDLFCDVDIVPDALIAA